MENVENTELYREEMKLRLSVSILIEDTQGVAGLAEGHPPGEG